MSLNFNLAHVPTNTISRTVKSRFTGEDEEKSQDGDESVGSVRSVTSMSKVNNSSHDNIPVLIAIYTYPITQETYALVLALLHSGMVTVNVELPTNALSTNCMKIVFEWPTDFVFPFKCLNVCYSDISPVDSRVTGLLNALHSSRSSVKELLKSSFTLNLPINTQTDESTHFVKGAYLSTGKNVRMQLLCIDLKETQSECTLNKVAKTIKHD